MKQPLIGLTVALGCGIYCASKTALPLWIISVLTLFSAGLTIATIRRGAHFVVCSCAWFFCIGALAWGNSRYLPPCHISRYLGTAPRQFYIIQGFASDESRRDVDTMYVRLRSEHIQANGINRVCSGDIQVAAKMPQDIRYGQKIVVGGYLTPPRNPYAKRAGIAGNIRPRGVADIVVAAQEKGLRCTSFALFLKSRAQHIIHRFVSSGPAAILEAMVLGEKKNIPRHIMQAMVRTGTVHILVVSGFNVGVVAFAAMLVLKIFRLPRSPRFIVVILLLVVYCLATGASTPVVRATVMAAIMLTACLCHRQPDVWNALCLAAMSILLASPSQLFDIGFQLSFSSVIAILWLYPKIRTRLAVAQCRHRGLRFCVDNYLVSLSAWLGTCGWIACSFKIFSPVTVVANIFIVPLASLITLCGVSLLAAAGVFPYICPAIGRTCELLVFALVSINNFFLSLPCAYFHLA